MKKNSQFFHVFHSKANYFGTLELHVVKLIVMLLCCDCPRRFDIRFDRIICFAGL